mmetsp:Transcript_41116/g.116297  ORF Transcript_41116/g.116297 Transcript_41116/m.116297 type:complete len:221 (-) Transcript_41116:8-670(-)
MGSRGCTFRKLCCCYYGCFCFVLLAVVVVVVILVATFEKPDVQVTSASLSGLTTNATVVSMLLNLTVRVENPNRWPIEGTVEELEASIYSLDKGAADGRGQTIYLGVARLPEAVPVDAQSQTNFVVSTTLAVAAGPLSALLLARLSSNCGAPAQSSGKATTKLEVIVRHVVAEVIGIDLELHGIDVAMTTLAPCQTDGDFSVAVPTPSAGVAGIISGLTR